MPQLQPAKQAGDILITGRLPKPAHDLLAKYSTVRAPLQGDRLPAQELCKEIRTARALVCFLYDRIDRKVIDSAPHLRVIANVAVGFNNIDVAYAAARGIWVTNTPGALTNATADGTMALLLAVARHVVTADRYVRKGKFKNWDFYLFLGKELFGKKLGIVGMGAVGQAVARRALGFGMKTLYCTRSRLGDSQEKALGARRVSLSQLLRQSDIISLHVPLNESTFHLLGAAEFRLVKRGAILINTSRGPVVDEKALVDALLDGRLSGAGLDVYEREPAIEKELLDMSQVVLLPHIASATSTTRLNMALMAARNVVYVMRGKRPPNPVCVPERKPR